MKAPHWSVPATNLQELYILSVKPWKSSFSVLLQQMPGHTTCRLMIHEECMMEDTWRLQPVVQTNCPSHRNWIQNRDPPLSCYHFNTTKIMLTTQRQALKRITMRLHAGGTSNLEMLLQITKYSLPVWQLHRSTSKSENAESVYSKYSGHIQLKWSRVRIKISSNKLLQNHLLILSSFVK